MDRIMGALALVAVVALTVGCFLSSSGLIVTGAIAFCLFLALAGNTARNRRR